MGESFTEELAAKAASALVNAMVGSAWGTLRDAIANVISRGDKKSSEREQVRLEKARQALSTTGPSSREVLKRETISAIKSRIETILEMHPELENDLSDVLANFELLTDGGEPNRVNVVAADQSIVQAAGRDLTIGSQTFGSVGRAESANPQ